MATDPLEPPVRDRLLAAGTRLFAERGYDATSVQQVVQAAAVTKGAFYYYFDSKDDLLLEIYRRLLDLQAARLDAFVTGPGAAADRLRAAAVDVVLSSAEHLDAFVVFVRSAHLLDEEHDRAVRARRRAYHDRFRELVEQGQREGDFRRDVSADLAVHAFLGAAHQIPTWFKPSGSLGIEQVAEQFADLLLRGISRPDGPRS